MKTFTKWLGIIVMMAIAAMLFASIVSCTDETEPNLVPSVQSSQYARFDSKDAVFGDVYQVLEFYKDGTGRTDYKIDKEELYTEITAFTYLQKGATIWISAHNNPKQIAQIEGENIRFGGHIYYPVK